MPRPAQRPPLVTVALVLLALAWPPLVLHWFTAAVQETFSFVGDRPTAAERSRAAGYLLRGTLCAVVLPVLGWLLDRLTGGRGRFWPTAVVVGAVVAGVLAAGAHETGP